MALIDKSGIASGSIIYPEHVLRSIEALRGDIGHDIVISGSLLVSASTIKFPDLIQNNQATAFVTFNTSSGDLYFTTSSGINSESSSYALTASYALNAGQSTEGYIFTQSVNATTWSISHNLNTDVPLINVYDNDYYQVVPTQIISLNNNSTEVQFSSPITGYAILSKGGGAATASSLSASYALTASYISGGGDLSNALVTASISSSILIFTKGDSSTFNLNLEPSSNISSVYYNNNVRYVAYDNGVSGRVEIISTGNVYSNLSWVRSSTTLSVSQSLHGLTSGDYILIRNMNVDYLYSPINVIDPNTFDITVTNTGDTSGSLGTYIPAFKVENFTQGGVTITPPTNGNVQLNSINVTTGPKSSTTFTLIMPNSISNGAGTNSGLTSQNPPIMQAYKLSTGQQTTTAAVSLNTTSNYNQFTINGLQNLVNNLIRLSF